MMKNICSTFLFLILFISVVHGQSTAQRTNNEPHKKTNYLSDQAVEITEKNNRNKKSRERAAVRRRNKDQQVLNELNKPKSQKKNNGGFNIY